MSFPSDCGDRNKGALPRGTLLNRGFMRTLRTSHPFTPGGDTLCAPHTRPHLEQRCLLDTRCECGAEDLIIQWVGEEGGE